MPFSTESAAMHLLTEKSIRIQRSALEVFEYVSNLETFGEWFPGVIAIDSLDALPHDQPGKAYLETVSIPWRGTRKIALTVREVRGHHFFATEGQLPPLMPRMEIALEDSGTGACEITWRMFSRSDKLITRYTVVPLARRVMGPRAALGLSALKNIMEKA
jgi:hypothetical protein